MSLTLTTLGTGTALPDAQRGPTSTLLSTDTTRVVVDLGSGALQKLAGAGHSPLTIDAVLLTHAHLDHIADVFPLLFTFIVPYYRRTSPLRLIATADTLGRIDAARAAFDHWMQTDQVVFEPIAAGDVATVGDLTITAGTVDHDASSVGYRFADANGRVAAVPGDSAPCDGLDALLRGATLAVLECSTPDDVFVPGHLTPTSLAEAATRAGLDHVVVTHRYPLAQQIDVVREIARGFSGQITVADDGQRFDVG